MVTFVEILELLQGRRVGAFLPSEIIVKLINEHASAKTKCRRRLNVEIAIQAHMRKFEIDRETAEYWIHSAMGG